MAHSAYPRCGQRIAPATLRELLQVPVPAKYLQGNSNAGLQLCDLDETAWQRFGDAACRELAREVVQAAARAARMPMPIADRCLPSLPPGTKLSDLDLEGRTLNCLVAAGIHERPQDLRAMTVERILGLRGFWIKCLVDLLTSLEYVAEHPEARKGAAAQLPAAARCARALHRYPRPNQRLAPQTLREILAEPIPAHLVRGTQLEGSELCDLDETVWDHLHPAAIAKLAERIVVRVSAGGYSRAIRQRRLPKPPKGLRLEDLRLENRTLNCLQRQGLAKRPEELGKLTVGELLSIKAFGAKCLVDLLSALETLAAREGKLDYHLTSEAKALGKIPEAGNIHFSDLRLGSLLRGMDCVANTIGEMVQHILKRRADPPDPVHLSHQISQLRNKVSELAELSLAQELTQVFSSAASDRDGQIVAAYYGWDGGGGRTLEELGSKFGLSRERIRQVCARAIKRSRGPSVFAPVLDRTLALIAQRLPVPVEKLEAELNAAGSPAAGLSLAVIQQAARFLSRAPQFALAQVRRHRLVVKPEWVSLPRLIVPTAAQLVQSFGTATLAEVAAELARRLPRRTVEPVLIRESLQALEDFRWLDQARGWFRLDCRPQYGLPNLVRKVLSVTGRIEISKLKAAAVRCQRTGRRMPPAGVLLEFCRQLPAVRVEGRTVVADPPLDWRMVLSGVERTIVEVLKQYGPVMERGALEQRCLSSGMNRFSFNAIIMCSPVITQFGRSIYGLLGARADRSTIEVLTARKSAPAPTKVLTCCGYTEEGQVYLAYRLSKAAISGGVITVPAALKEEVRGKFTILAAGGRKAGTLVSKNGCAWGLGPALRGHLAKPGDHLLILLDTARSEARIRIGGETIFQRIRQREESCV